MSALQIWSWSFLVLYLAAMIAFGVLGKLRVRGGDDFATARGSYGPFFLALAFTATTASGGTFLGVPGLAYKSGVSSLWYAFGYPFGVYGGVILCAAAIWRAGASFGNRSIPEFLGDRYQSEFLRVGLAIFSLMLLFYLAGQMVAGLVVFERMLGLSAGWALAITTGVLLIYISLGGAHADILTDGVQGGLMLVLSLAVAIFCFTGFGTEGGFGAVLSSLEHQDPQTVQALNAENPIFDSAWDIFAIIFAHIPLGLLPHIGNKLWALRGESHRSRFLILTCAFGFILPAMSLGGLLARAILGDALLPGGGNAAIPALFIEVLPLWLAALLGVGILSAVMSTADGLVISSSQVFANDIYRRSIAPRWHRGATPEQLDRRVLVISRVATFAVLISSASLAWWLIDMNVALLIWIGVGGMIAAMSGPLFSGIFWRGVTRAGANAGFLTGASVFIVTKAGLIPTVWAAGTFLQSAVEWIYAQNVNPFACATLAMLASLGVTVLVSLGTRRLSDEHLERSFGA